MHDYSFFVCRCVRLLFVKKNTTDLDKMDFGAGAKMLLDSGLLIVLIN